MDRDELQDRIRMRRSGGEPYRRGGVPDDAYGGYERFEPDPADAQARRTVRPDERRRDVFQERVPTAAAAAPVEAPSESLVPPIETRRDVTREPEDWSSAPAPTPPPAPARIDEEPRYVDNFDDEAYPEEGYPYEDWEEDRERRTSGAGAFAILGFLALGVLALLSGAVLAGIFSGDPGTGTADPTLTPSPTVAESTPSGTESVTASPDASAAPSGEPRESGAPVVFPDGFTAEAQPCIPGSAGLNGCDSNASSNSGNVWVWVGFENGTEEDVIGAEVVGPDGTTVGEGSIDLARIGCSPTCPGGWTYFPFSGLPAGTYEVRITRNGEPASQTTFEVS